MATRIQLRRGTATQWTTADPILEAGEIGWESNTNKFKIGDGINNWEDLTYFLDSTDTGFNAEDYILATSKNAVSGVAALDANINVVTTTGVVFEGATANEHELTLAIAADPTSDRTITLPDATGTVQLRVADVSDTEIGYLNGVTSSIQTQLDDKSTASKTETLTNKTITTPIVSGLTLSDSSIVIEGSSADDHETTITVTNPTADRTITFPDVTGTVITTGNLSDITNAGTFTGNIVIEGATADDHELTLSAGNPTADRTITVPDETGTGQLRVTDVSATEIGYLNGVTSGIQTQLDARVEESLFDAKGDLLVGSADNTPAKLTVGTNGYILTANSSATNGVEWAAAPAGYSPPTLGSTQISSGATVTTIAGLTLSTPTVSGLAISDGSIVIEGATADEYETTLQFTDPTADRTITFPDATGTVALAANVAALSGATFTGAVSGTSLTLSGDLTVNGTTTTINSTTLTVDDINITLGQGNTSDASANGGGITLEGATNKTFNWIDATDAWTSSEHMNLVTGKSYKINGTSITAAIPAGLTWGEVKDGKSGLVIS